MGDKNRLRQQTQTFEYVEGLSEFDLRKPKRTLLSEYSIDQYGEMVPATVTVEVKNGENFGGEEIKCSICLGIICTNLFGNSSFSFP